MDFPVFDGHNDTLTQIQASRGTETERDFFVESDHGHIDYPRAIKGGLTGGFFAIFVPNPKSDGWEPTNSKYYSDSGYAIPLPPEPE